MKKLLLTSFALIALVLTTHAERIFVLTSANRLITIDSAEPGTAITTVPITGLGSGESLVGIDFRPGTGGLYGVGDGSRLYSIDQNTGVATAVGAAGAFSIFGSSFGVDFNPTADRLRVVSASDQNLRINPNNGTLAATDPLLSYAATDPNNGSNANVVGSAYSNNFAGAGATVLYGIDSNLDILVVQDPPNNGTLNTVGALGVDTADEVGFDVSPTTGVAFASLTIGGVPKLHSINLRTGAATPTNATDATIAPAARGGEGVVDIAASANPGTALRNMSTRGRVTTGENILIAGFIARGAGPAGNTGRFVIRAIGPSLSGFGVAAPLADPVLTLFDNNQNVVATNDDFSASPDAAAITAAGLAPTNGQESAIIIDLAPGTYTAQVTGKGVATGVAVVEVYELP